MAGRVRRVLTAVPLLAALPLVLAGSAGTTAAASSGGSPFGSVDRFVLQYNGAVLDGWAIDPDTRGPVDIRLTLDGRADALTIPARTNPLPADEQRPDVGRAHPRYGEWHGFHPLVEFRTRSPQAARQLCATALDVGPGRNTPLGCFAVPTLPFGALDAAEPTPGAVRARGWMTDPDTAGQRPVHVYVDGHGVATQTDQPRPDVGAAHPPFGEANKGWSVTVPAPPTDEDTRRVCAYGINAGSGSGNPELGCRTTTTLPFGVLDTAVRTTDGLEVSGWAIDPDTGEPIDVHVYTAAGVGYAMRADQSRPDVERAHPEYRDQHGFQQTVPLEGSSAQVCAFGINVGSGQTNSLLGCRDVA